MDGVWAFSGKDFSSDEEMIQILERFFDVILSEGRVVIGGNACKFARMFVISFYIIFFIYFFDVCSMVHM